MRFELRIGLGALFVLVLAACAGQPTLKCSFTCAGCCLDEVCVAPEEQDAFQCGSLGRACQSCLTGEVCASQGFCVAGSGSSNGGPPDASVRDAGGSMSSHDGGVVDPPRPPTDGGVVDPPRPPTDGGAPPNNGLLPTGSACTANSQCAGGLCSTETPAGDVCPTAACWPKGYCTQACPPGTVCAAGSSCVTTLPIGPRCFADCTYDGGRGSCRPGYVCDRNWASNTPSPSCVYACATSADCPSNTQCNAASGFCCGRTTYSCCPGNTCPFGGTCGSNGYCQ